VQSGAVDVIEWEPEQKAARSERLAAVQWDARAQVLTVQRAGGDVTQHRLVRGAWERTAQIAKGEHLRLRVVEAQTEAPRLYAAIGTPERVLFDPNPQVPGVTLGSARLYSWRDNNGIAWDGGLILPPGYSSSRRYPVVIQTHGFSKNEFLIDGPHGMTTAM